MNGHVLPGTPIAVDIWRLKDIKNARVFFLSHAHADHTAGLTSTWRNTIYTSPITAKIILHKLNVSSHLIKSLELMTTHLIPLDPDRNENIAVTLLDANHCPGSVMFVFQGYFGTILYTGDFRYSHEMIVNIRNIAPDGINTLYLDNTYCNPKYNFPPREEVMFKIIEFITAHEEDFKIVIGMRYLGKEELLLIIAKHFQRYISIDETRLELYKQLQLPKIFTTDKQMTNFHVEPFWRITKKNMKIWNEKSQVVAVLPTSLYVGMSMHPFPDEPRVFIAEYSDHSSFTELIQFVQGIRPGLVRPINTNKCNSFSGIDVTDFSVFDKFLDRDRQFEFEVPNSVSKLIRSTTCFQNVTKLPRLLTKKKIGCKIISSKVKGIKFYDSHSPLKSQNGSLEEITITDSEDSEQENDMASKKLEIEVIKYISPSEKTTSLLKDDGNNFFSNSEDDIIVDERPNDVWDEEKKTNDELNENQSSTSRKIKTNNSDSLPEADEILFSQDSVGKFSIIPKSPAYCDDFNKAVAENILLDTSEEDYLELKLQSSTSPSMLQCNESRIPSSACSRDSSSSLPLKSNQIYITSPEIPKLDSDSNEFVLGSENSDFPSNICSEDYNFPALSLKNYPIQDEEESCSQYTNITEMPECAGQLRELNDEICKEIGEVTVINLEQFDKPVCTCGTQTCCWSKKRCNEIQNTNLKNKFSKSAESCDVSEAKNEANRSYENAEKALAQCLHQSCVEFGSSSSDSSRKLLAYQWAAIEDMEEKIFKLGKEERFQEAIDLELTLKWQCQKLGLDSLN